MLLNKQIFGESRLYSARLLFNSCSHFYSSSHPTHYNPTYPTLTPFSKQTAPHLPDSSFRLAIIADKSIVFFLILVFKMDYKFVFFFFLHLIKLSPIFLCRIKCYLNYLFLEFSLVRQSKLPKFVFNFLFFFFCS